MPKIIAKHNLSRGFPDTWLGRPMEIDYSNALYQKFFGEEDNGLIVNTTWGDIPLPGSVAKDKYLETLRLVQGKHANKVLLVNFVDDWDLKWSTIVKELIIILGKNNVKVVGYSPDYADVEFQFWALFAWHHFRIYKDSEISPKSFSNLYLCYNRKPRGHRVELYNQFKKDNLLDLGVFTLGYREDSKDLITFESNVANSTDPGIPDADGNGIPLDVVSLGNINVWQNSFLIIVTESGATPHNNKNAVFLTEKTFKPIIGKRPFLLYGEGENFYKWLSANGFRSFNHYFGLPEQQLSPYQISSAIQQLKNADIDELYAVMKDDIDHNYENFYRYCEKEEQRILTRT